MDRALVLETTFLIDLERERSQLVDGPATQFLRQYAEHRLFITHTVAGELAAGVSLSERSRWESFTAPFRILPITEDVDWEYGKAFRYLQRNGLLIGANDLWIAATAVAFDTPLVTRNHTHFGRVPGLDVITYGE